MELEKQQIQQDSFNVTLNRENGDGSQMHSIELIDQKSLLNELGIKIQSVFRDSKIQLAINQNIQPCISMQNYILPNSPQLWDSLQGELLPQIYKTLFSPKLVKYMIDYLNQKMRESFKNQSEKQIRKKFFKIDEVYDFFGIKIMMGYIKMPTLEDYFDEKQLFQCKIFDCFKEGRVKCLEQWSCFTDSELLKKKSNYVPLNEFQTSKICKKIGKIILSVKNPNRELILQVNSGFSVAQHSNAQQIILSDAQTKIILWSHFVENKIEEFVSLEIVQFLKQFSNRNHVIYCYNNLLSIEQIVYLKQECKIQCVTMITNNFEIRLPFYHPILSIINQSPEIFAITTGDKISDVMLNYKNYKDRMLHYFIHKNRPTFSYIDYPSAIMTELQEIIIWDLWMLASSIKGAQQQQSYEQFRLQFSQELLQNKITQIKNVPTFLHKQKTASVLVNTESGRNYGQGAKNTAASQFHIPTILATPKSYAGSMNCLVCKRNTQLITQCKSCSEISGKLVILCACDCFYLFHQNTHQYIINGEDITQGQYKQIEQASQQLYFQAFQQKPGLMYENPDKPKQIAYAKQVELE